jgi:glycosyltransferase involved in cell wall biosynthesis
MPGVIAGPPAASLGPVSEPISLLFLDQGRPTTSSAMGHVRVRHAIERSVDPADLGLHVEFASVPPFATRPGRLTIRPVPPLGAADLWSLRFALARSKMARDLVRARLADRPPDLVQVTTDQAGLLMGRLQARVPCVMSLDSLYLNWNRITHGIAPGEPTPWHLRPVGALERRALESAPLVMAWTDTVAADVRAAAPRAKVETLHPGLDLETFRPRERTAPSERMRVLFVGGLWQEKGGPDLLAALEPHLGRTVDLDVVSPAEIPQREGVRTMQATPGSDEILQRFSEADVLCLPTRRDACPWVVVEALASGLPVVSTRVGSIPELVSDAGTVVDAGDVTALRAALEQLIAEPERRAQLGRAGRERAERLYDARRNAPDLLGRLARVAREQIATR